jgi:AcrR family transcriptional regulator
MSERARDTYHHGDLRQSLLASAMDLVDERGIDGFTLREVARRAGVSHNAPYHHFADKAALIEALAIEGYEGLRADEQAALEAAAGRPIRERIVALGRAYIGYAVANPSRFTLMNRPELRLHDAISLTQASGMEAYAPLLDTIAEGQEAGELASGDGAILALAAWAHVHGFAMLVVDGPMRHQVQAGPELDAMVEGILEVLLDGMSASPPPA